MNRTARIGIIGDFDSSKTSHLATNDALHHAAEHLSIEVDISWLPTPSLLTVKGEQRLQQFNGLLAAPGGAYQSLDGALRGIQLARQFTRTFLGT